MEKTVKERTKNHHGAVGKLSSEEQFHKSDRITYALLNFWSRTLSATGSYVRMAAWLVDKIKAIFEIFKIQYT